MATQIAWQEGTPRTEELYLVAIGAGTDKGYYAISYWDGRTWSESIKDKVVGFFPANQLLDQLVDQLDINWPKSAHAGSSATAAAESDWQDTDEGQIFLNRHKAPPRMAFFMEKNNDQPGLS